MTRRNVLLDGEPPPPGETEGFVEIPERDNRFDRIAQGLKIALALPAYQIVNLVTYANTRQGWPAKLATIAAFLPIFALTTVCWAAGWTLALWLALRLMN
jgi:hypothetical protein